MARTKKAGQKKKDAKPEVVNKKGTPGKKGAPPAKKGSKTKTAPPEKGKTGSVGGRKGSRGKRVRPGKGLKKDVEKKPKTAEELDAELTAYMMKDEKTALKTLDEEMDAYRAEGAKKKEEKGSTDASA